jgi:hypothetical protein
MATTPLRFPADFAQHPTAALGTAALDGVIYRLRFWPSVRANDGGGAWYVDLSSVTGVPSVRAVKLILSSDLFGSYRTTTAVVPPGRLVVRRTDGVDDEPRPTRRGEIGTQVATLGSPRLVVEYVDAADG